MLTQRVDLRSPIQLHGAEVTFVTARPISTAGYELALTGPEGQLEAFAACIGLPMNVAAEMDDIDYSRVTRAIARLNRRTAEEALAERRAKFTVFEGGRA